MAFNFNDELRRVLAIGREEATRLQHNYLGTEHLLLALARQDRSVGATVLIRLHVDLEGLRQGIEESVPRGTFTHPRVEPLPGTMSQVDIQPYTSGAKKAIHFTITEAREGGHTEIGTGHLLIGQLREGQERPGVVAVLLSRLGLLRGGWGVAAEYLGRHGVSLEDARREPGRK